jgi:hypothetical protein
VYYPALGNNFVNWDDTVYVYENSYLTAPDIDFIKWSLSTFRNSNWHPLAWISLSLDYAFWELDPAGYHLTNIVLHAINTLLVTLLTGFLFKKAMDSLDGSILFAAALVGIVFGLHPLHVESVAWVSERKDVLYAFFWLLSVIVYIRYASSVTLKRRRLYYFICLTIFLLSLLSKSMAVTLPVVLLILDFYPLKRLNLRKDFVKIAILEKLPFFLLSLIFSIVTIIAQKKGGAMEAMNYLSLPERLWGAVKAIGFYLVKTVWPVNLVPLYPLRLNISQLTWEYPGSLFIVLCITAISLRLRKRAPVIIAAWIYYLITLMPVIGIIQVGAQAAADRYMYLPVLGPLMVLAALNSKIWKTGKKVHYLLIALSFFLAMVMSFLTVKQISVWKDSVTLWEYVIEKKPGAVQAHYNLGNAYREKGNLLRAEKAWRRTVEIDPTYSPALNQLGNIAYFSNLFVKAKEYYYAAVESDDKNAEAHYNLALTLEKLSETDEAFRHYKIFLDIASSEYTYLFPDIRKKLSVKKNN